MLHRTAVDDTRIVLEMLKAESAASRSIRDTRYERDVLFAAVSLVTGERFDPIPFCEDYGIDPSLGKPSKLEILKHAIGLVHQRRRASYPAPAETLPVSDIPLELADP